MSDAGTQQAAQPDPETKPEYPGRWAAEAPDRPAVVMHGSGESMSFAELDAERRDQLAGLVAGAEQVLVTAAVPEDVPEALAGARYVVAGGEVTRDG